MTELKEGGKFGDYKVVRRLGKGGMGEVWLEGAGDHKARKRFVCGPSGEERLGFLFEGLREARKISGEWA